MFKFWLADAGYKIPHILPHLDRTRRVLDVGAGPGTVSLLLRQQGFDTVPVDIDDFSLKPAPPSRVYDGVRLPFADNSHHTALLLTVLHHTDDPKAVLQEASRVAERVVVMEDLPRNGPHRILSLVIDAFANLEFTGHACNDKTHSQWLALFDELQLEVVEVRYHWFSCFYRGTYLLKKRG